MLGGLASAQVALAAGPILQVTADGTSSVRPSWSPDGTHIAFQTSQDNAYRVYTMAADGSDRRLISQGAVDDRHPAAGAVEIARRRYCALLDKAIAGDASFRKLPVDHPVSGARALEIIAGRSQPA